MPIATKTCQDVVQGAVAFSASNASLIGVPSELLERIRGTQRAVFTHIATQSREYLVTAVILTSSTGASVRTFDISTVSPPIERILQIITATGRTLNQVDVLDTGADYAPRYYAAGLTLNELNAEWGPSGPVSATLYYVYGPVDIDPFSPLGLNQQLTLPDQWIDILIGDLAAYLAHKDHRRDPTGQAIAQAKGLSDTRMAELDTFLYLQAGDRSMRTDVPMPSGPR